MLRKSEALALCRGEHGDPFAVLGMHTDGKGRLWLRTMQPGASAVFVIETESGKEVLELAQRKLDAIADIERGLSPPTPPVRPPAGLPE